MAGTAYTTRMPIGIAGAVTRPRDLTIEPVVLDHTKQFASYGLPGKYVNDQFVPLESGDTIDKVKGILVRPFPITSAADLAYIGVEANQVGDNLKRGYICVKVTAGNATAAKKGIRCTSALLVAPHRALLVRLCCRRIPPPQTRLS